MERYNTRIWLRADASAEIGYGHFVRLLALGEMLSGGFELVFATRNPTPLQIQQIEAVCSSYVALGDDHFSAFLSLIQPTDIVVLDNYFFDTDYQQQIKAKGCKLVCVDDMHDKHYVADVVINHGLSDPSLFSIEPYTRLCLGLDWALLRHAFRYAAPRTQRETGHCVVAFGGVDKNNLTGKVSLILAQNPTIQKITAIVGDAYAHEDRLQGVKEIAIRKNLSATQVADLFCRVEFAVLPTSTICIEAIACRCPIAAGYYVNNQREFYTNLFQQHLIVGLDNFTRLNVLSTNLANSLLNLAPSTPAFGQIAQKYRNLIASL